MDVELAIRILDKETTSAAIRELEYYAGFDGDKVMDAIEEAMQMGADALRKIQQMNKKCEIDESMNDLLRECGFEE